MRLLPTIHVSKFEPAMSWGKSPTGRGHQGSQIARMSSLYPFPGEIDTRIIAERGWQLAACIVEGSVPVAHEPVIPLIAYRFPKTFAKDSKLFLREAVFGNIHSEVALLLLLRTVGLMKMFEADHHQFILRHVGMF
jgi:hypothetical protein